MDRRPLGASGRTISSIGLGCMAMSEFYGPSDETAAMRTLHRAVEIGIDFFDTADMYGPYENEQLLGRFLREIDQSVTVATKFGIVRSSDPAARGVDNRPEYIRLACEGSLRRLGVEQIDLYYVHRVDRSVPIEETVGILAELVQSGKVGMIGLSEVSAETLRRAHATFPITAVQSEYSLFSRDPEHDGVLEACDELGISFVAYSPLGRGLLTSAPPTDATLSVDDFRRHIPRFGGESLERNLSLAHQIRSIGYELGRSPAQVALAWLLGKGDKIIPIPGTRRIERLEENAAASELSLPIAVVDELDRMFEPGRVVGNRSSNEGMKLLGA